MPKQADRTGPLLIPPTPTRPEKPRLRNNSKSQHSRLGFYFLMMCAASMAEYKFKIGETVYFHPKLPIDASRGAYQIIRRLPTAEGEFQYVIRSVNEDRQRVAKENELSRI